MFNTGAAMDRRLSLVAQKAVSIAAGNNDVIDLSEKKIDTNNIDVLSSRETAAATEAPPTACERLVGDLQTFYHKARVQKILPLLILVGYTFIGGLVIYYIEMPAERRAMETKQRFLDEQKENLISEMWSLQGLTLSKQDSILRLKPTVFWYTVALLYLNKELPKVELNTGEIMNKIDTLSKYIDEMAGRCWEIQIHEKNRSQARRKVDEALILFEQLSSVSSKLRNTWTFSNALFLAITIYTTIGYGSVAPDTTTGKVATIVYAICGIPLYLLILHKFGRLFLAVLHKFYGYCLWIFHKCRCIAEPTKYGETSKISFKSGSGNDESYNVPVSLAIGVTFGWMFACAGIFCSFFETSWDYFTSFYFFFISLTTIGFGDVIPSRPEDMFAIFGFIIIGLSLVSMCINVVQLKLELLFEEMMLTLMEEYREAQLLEAQLTEPSDVKPSPGLSTLFKVWKTKHHASGIGSNLYMPLMGRKQQRVLMDEWKKKAQMKVAGTQTDPSMFHTWRNIFTQTDADADDSDSKKRDLLSSYQQQSPGYQLLKGADSAGSLTKTKQIQSTVSKFASSASVPHSNSASPVRVTTAPKVVTASVSAEIHRHPAGGVVDESSRLLVGNVEDYDEEDSTVVEEEISPVQQATAVFGAESAPPPPPVDVRVFRAVPNPMTTISAVATAAVPYAKSAGGAGAGSAPSTELPAMFIKKQSKTTSTSDFQNLLHEIGARITECQNIITPSTTPQLIQKPKKLWDDDH